MHQTPLARLHLRADLTCLSAALDFVRSLLNSLGLPREDIGRLALVTEEAAVNVIEHAYDPGEVGYYDIEVQSHPDHILLAVEDNGLPFDFGGVQPQETTGVGMRLMRAFVDEVRFLSLGPRGKRVEFIKKLPVTCIAEEGAPEQVQPAPGDVTIVNRLMTADDAVGMARCVYRSYGYTYCNDFVYYPDLVKERMERGVYLACVSVANGEVIGHAGLIYDEPGDLVAEGVIAVVDPRYRSHGVFNQLSLFLLEQERRLGMYGMFTEAVAVHHYTQKANLTQGAHETGLAIGVLPETMYFRKIYSEDKQKRQSVVLFYMKLADGPVRTVFLPMHHAGIIRRIYQENGLERIIGSISDIREHPPEQSVAEVRLQASAAMAYIKVRQVGQDLPELMRYRLRELCLQKTEIILLDLPLPDPGTMQVCAALELLGFFFCGVIPELYHGDVLRLQYLNNIEPELEKIVRVSAFCNELYEYIVRCHAGKLTL